MEKKLVKCPKCGYEWKTGSTKIYVSCPNCMRKVKVGNEVFVTYRCKLCGFVSHMYVPHGDEVVLPSVCPNGCGSTDLELVN